MDDEPVIKPGPSKCLKCDRQFQSRDVCTHRICPKCTKANSKEYVPRIVCSRGAKDLPPQERD